jgi:hypothetical protein
MRYVLLLPLIAVALAAQVVPGQRAPQPSAAQQRKIPCKVPKNASMCYWTRGALAIYNGTPSWRIWKVGTKRILGVYSGPDAEKVDPLDNEHPEFPTNLDRAYEAEYKRKVKASEPDAGLPDTVWADFEVCPLEPERKGPMQAVCIESSKNIFLQKHSFAPRYGAWHGFP